MPIDKVGVSPSDEILAPPGAKEMAAAPGVYSRDRR